MIELTLSAGQRHCVAGFDGDVVLGLARLSDPAPNQRLRRAQLRGEALSMLGSFLGRPVTGTDLLLTASGKPVLGGLGPHFSWSYAGRHVLLGVSEAHPIGVDLEPIAELPEADDLIDRFCGSQASEVRRATSPSLGFLGWWTETEAASKAAGLRMADVLDDALAPRVRRGLVTRLRLDGFLLGAVSPAEALNYDDQLAVGASEPAVWV